MENTTRVYDDILGAIEWSPLVRINRICSDCKCEVWAKCEFLNPGGSVKDRIARRMVEEGFKESKFKEGSKLIEPTSGNTGIGLALAASVKGLDAHIVMPHKMSSEKARVLTALGANVHRTPTEASFDEEDSHIETAFRLEKELEGGVIPDQYTNINNPDAHYFHTGEEIVKQIGKVDVLVAGAGTGGTVTGIAKRLKEENAQCKVVCVDPIGSILAEGGGKAAGGYQVEGTGYDFIPDVFDRSVVDEWYKSSDQETFDYARRIIKEEGLLVGGSSGATMAAAHKIAKTMKEGEKLVVVFPDSIRNYLSKFADDRWLIDYGFKQGRDLYGDKTIADLTIAPIPIIDNDASVKDAVKAIQGHKAIAIRVKRGLYSAISQSSLLSYVGEHGNLDLAARDAVQGDFRWVPSTAKLNVVHHTVARLGYCLVVDETGPGEWTCKGLVGGDDLLPLLR